MDNGWSLAVMIPDEIVARSGYEACKLAKKIQRRKKCVVPWRNGFFNSYWILPSVLTVRRWTSCRPNSALALSPFKTDHWLGYFELNTAARDAVKARVGYPADCDIFPPRHTRIACCGKIAAAPRAPGLIISRFKALIFSAKRRWKIRISP